MLTLNLENVDSPEAWDCPLVLTSPRSLTACRLLAIKPVELLPTDIMELAETIGTNDLAELAELRDLWEHRRLAKLEHCRAIRRYLISDEYHLLTAHRYTNEVGNISEEDSSVQNENIYRSNIHSPSRCSVTFEQGKQLHMGKPSVYRRKERLDIENTALAQERKILSRDSCGHRDLRPSSGGTPARLSAVRPEVFARRTNSSQDLVENGTTVSRKTLLQRQMRSDSPKIVEHLPKPVRNGGASRASSSNVGSQQQSENSKKYPSEISSETEPKNFRKGNESSNASELGARRKPCKRPRRRTRSLSASRQLPQSPAPTPASTLSAFGADLCEAGFRDRSTKCLAQQIRIKTPQYFTCRNKIAALGMNWRGTAEAVGLSEEDQKILRLLEKKALEKRACEMTAEAARILWEKEEEQRTKQQEWEKERRKLELAERRKEDKAETKRRLAYMEKNFTRAQRRLADTLRRRDEEAQQRLAKIAQQKDAMRAEKRAADLARQASVEKRLKHLNQEFRRQLNFQAEEIEARLRNAEGKREWCSSPAVQRRQMTSSSLVVLRRPSSAPRPTSATSDPRIVSARMVRDAIERNLAASRVRHVVQSEAAVRAAASRASARMKARSTRVRITCTRRRVAHLASAARLRAMRGAAVARLRSRIRAGERKIAALLAAKERSVANSRAAAAVAAHLRNNLRGSLSPTTFDRMASDVQNALRIPSSSRSWTAEHHSITHIKLG